MTPATLGTSERVHPREPLHNDFRLPAWELLAICLIVFRALEGRIIALAEEWLRQLGVRDDDQFVDPGQQPCPIRAA